MQQISITKNKLWDKATESFFSLITPVFNRPETLKRTIQSVQKQTFGNFEYIIVNDGSTEDIDSVVVPLMENAPFPVMYIKKPNGGVHTARNAGIRQARGILTVMIDSDDEMTSDALEVFHRTWMEIPESERKDYFQISARCRTDNGIEGPLFPDRINSLPVEKASILYEKIPFEIFLCNRTDVLKENPFPEPEGITFVLESILWFKLLRLYRVKCINDILRVYHTEGDDHVFSGKKSIQFVKNMTWSFAFFLNNWKERKTHLRNYLDILTKHCIFIKVLRINRVEIRNDFEITGFRDRFLAFFLFIPSLIAAHVYNSRKVSE